MLTETGSQFQEHSDIIHNQRHSMLISNPTTANSVLGLEKARPLILM
jgi:hypothetical protein